MEALRSHYYPLSSKVEDRRFFDDFGNRAEGKARGNGEIRLLFYDGFKRVLRFMLGDFWGATQEDPF